MIISVYLRMYKHENYFTLESSYLRAAHAASNKKPIVKYRKFAFFVSLIVLKFNGSLAYVAVKDSESMSDYISLFYAEMVIYPWPKFDDVFCQITDWSIELATTPLIWCIFHVNRFTWITWIGFVSA